MYFLIFHSLYQSSPRHEIYNNRNTKTFIELVNAHFKKNEI